MKKQKIVLTNDEWNVLLRLSIRSKMDCWFCLDSDGNEDFVRDLENKNKKMSLKNAVTTMNEGLCGDYGLSKREWKTYINLCNRLDIPDPYDGTPPEADPKHAEKVEEVREMILWSEAHLKGGFVSQEYLSYIAENIAEEVQAYIAKNANPDDWSVDILRDAVGRVLCDRLGIVR